MRTAACIASGHRHHRLAAGERKAAPVSSEEPASSLHASLYCFGLGWALAPYVEQDRGSEDNGRQEILLGLCQAWNHICDNLVEDCWGCQQQASITRHLHVTTEISVAHHPGSPYRHCFRLPYLALLVNRKRLSLADRWRGMDWWTS